jgi:hypothetical protein
MFPPVSMVARVDCVSAALKTRWQVLANKVWISMGSSILRIRLRDWRMRRNVFTAWNNSRKRECPLIRFNMSRTWIATNWRNRNHVI